jgi:hypothetical protein
MDFTSFIRESTTSPYFRVTVQTESSVGQLNSFRAKFDSSTCRFTELSDLRIVDFTKDNGTWTGCAGSITPWNTHLGSEVKINNFVIRRGT